MNKKYRYGEERKCVVCSSVFRPRDSGTTQKCCSNTCRGVYQTRKASRECPICKAIFVPSRPGYETCSRKCGSVLRTSRMAKDPMTDIRSKLANFCCSAIARCLRNKTDRTASLLGYSSEDLRKHLEKHFETGMSWENYGKGYDEWSIDRSRPISSFPITASISEINAMENLRPMWHRKNCSKKNKWEGL